MTRHNLSGRLALVVSLLALVVALGGTSYAAVKISGKQIKKNAITSVKVKDDSLTGADVAESTLAKVPAAAAADTATRASSADTATTATTATSATTAGSAGAVNGFTLVPISYRSTDATPRTVFSGGGLTITATCAGATTLTLTATTTKPGSSIVSSLVDVETDTVYGNDLESGSFTTASVYDLLKDVPAAGWDPAQSSFTYLATDGTVVTGQYYTDWAGTPNGCVVSGIAQSNRP
jgi:hypothetical protein